MGAAAPAQQLLDRTHLRLDLLAAAAVHHGEQVVRPDRRMARAMIAVAHERQRPDLAPRLGDRLVLNIPYRHAVGAIAQGIMIGHDTDAPDDAAASMRRMHAITSSGAIPSDSATA